jgi:hypothetical protein
MKFGCPQAIFNLSMLGASDAIGSSPRSRRCAQYSSPFAATIRRRARRHLPARRHRTHGRDRQSSAPRRDVASLREPLPPARLRAVHCVNKHRSWTPGLRAANLLICFVNLADNRGPDRRRPGRISSRYIKALRSSELGSRFGAYSHPKSCSRPSSPPSAPQRFRLGTCRLFGLANHADRARFAEPSAPGLSHGRP